MAGGLATGVQVKQAFETDSRHDPRREEVTCWGVTMHALIECITDNMTMIYASILGDL